MTTATLKSLSLGRGLDAMKELAVHNDWGVAMSFAPAQLESVLHEGYIERRNRVITKRTKFPSFRFEYRLTKKGREEFLDALERKPIPVTCSAPPVPPAPKPIPPQLAPISALPPPPKLHVPTVSLAFELGDAAGLIAIKVNDKISGRAIGVAYFDAEDRASLIHSIEAAGDEADKERHIDLKTRRFG